MKKYNLIGALSFSECLRRAWADAEAAVSQPKQYTLEGIKALAHKNIVTNK